MKRVVTVIMILALAGIVLMGGACSKVERISPSGYNVQFNNHNDTTVELFIQNGPIVGLRPMELVLIDEFFNGKSIIGNAYRIAGDTATYHVAKENDIW